MSRFLDTHTVPGVNREAILEACKAMKAAPGVTFVACHYDLGEGKVFRASCSISGVPLLTITDIHRE